MAQPDTPSGPQPRRAQPRAPRNTRPLIQPCWKLGAPLTWDENSHGLLLAQNSVEDGAGHVPHRAVSHHQSRLHAEQPFGVLGVGLRERQELLSAEVSPLHLGLREPPRGCAHHADPILLRPCDAHLRGRAHTCRRQDVEPRDPAVPMCAQLWGCPALGILGAARSHREQGGGPVSGNRRKKHGDQRLRKLSPFSLVMQLERLMPCKHGEECGPRSTLILDFPHVALSPRASASTPTASLCKSPPKLSHLITLCPELPFLLSTGLPLPEFLTYTSNS